MMKVHSTRSDTSENQGSAQTSILPITQMLQRKGSKELQRIGKEDQRFSDRIQTYCETQQYRKATQRQKTRKKMPLTTQASEKKQSMNASDSSVPVNKEENTNSTQLQPLMQIHSQEILEKDTGVLPPLNAARITVTLEDKDYITPKPGKNQAMKGYLLRDQYGGQGVKDSSKKNKSFIDNSFKTKLEKQTQNQTLGNGFVSFDEVQLPNRMVHEAYPKSTDKLGKNYIDNSRILAKQRSRY